MERGNKNHGVTGNISERHACFARKAEEILMRKMSSFSGTGPSTNSIALKR